MDEAIAQFTSITGASADQAEQYLRLTDGNSEQAIQLFFEDPSLATSSAQPATSSSSHNQSHHRTDDQGVIHIDSDDEEAMDIDRSGAPESSRPVVDEDEAIARRLQEEMYGARPADTVRAPMARTTETLIGGDDEYGDEDVSAMVHEQLRRQQQRRARPGIFNQRDVPGSIWTNPESHPQNLATATGGASESSSRSNMLAEMFRPPFELMSRLSWEDARDEGREHEKWLLVNVQEPSIFDCQILNRDIWKNKEIKECVKEHFIFLQYLSTDPRGQKYFDYYFQGMVENPDSYPHIAIVDPRTGEQVKTWGGPPVPQANDFLMQLYEFLDRYSLKSGSRNPVAKRKVETKNLSNLTEEEQLEHAIAASLQNGSGALQADSDPDELTKSTHVGEGEGEGRGEDLIDLTSEVTPSQSAPPSSSPVSDFAKIAANKPHEEPPADPTTTTRIQFRYSGGRQVRRFAVADPVRRIYEWLKAAPIEGQEGAEFDLIFMGKNLIGLVEETIEQAGLKNGSVMVEFLTSEE